jgi:hypothetical protein
VDNWEQSEARERLAHSLQQNCPDFFDSDVTLSWQAYGSGRTYDATLQAAAPASFRLALVDPLGRPQMIFVSNAHRFTLADNYRAEGYTGPVGGSLMQKYLPANVAREELFFWLTGRPGITQKDVIGVDEDRESGAYWYRLQRKNMREYLILGPEQVERRIMQNSSGEIILDVRYAGYREAASGCLRPGELVVTGKGLPAEFRLVFTKFYPGQKPDQRFFELTLPPHFTLKHLRAP